MSRLTLGPMSIILTSRTRLRRLTKCGLIFMIVSYNPEVFYKTNPQDSLIDDSIVGTIGLTPSEAAKLTRPTPPTPKDPDTYPVMIQVFHNIHCLNLMRKAIWREFYPGIIDLHANGSIIEDSPSALHIGKHSPDGCHSRASQRTMH